MEITHFSISGDWLTDIIREFFWVDEKPISEIIKLLKTSNLESSSDEEMEKLSIDIIEGRKRLYGINNLKIINDNRKNVKKSISSFIEKERKEKMLLEIHDDMEYHPLLYVDTYSTKVSLDLIKRWADEVHIGISETVEYLMNEDYVFHYMNGCQEFVKDYKDRICDNTTMNGSWLLFNEGIVYDLAKKPLSELNKIEKDKFWDDIYTTCSKFFDKSFSDRNKKYELAKKNKSENEIFIEEKLNSFTEANPAESTLDYFLNNYDSFSSEEYGKMLEKVYPKEICTPKEVFSSMCWISPDGKFFPVSFGGHSLVAVNLIKCYYNDITFYKLEGKTKKQIKINKRSEIDKKIDDLYSKAVDILLLNGWIEITSDDGYHPDHIFTMEDSGYDDVNQHFSPTKQQEDVILMIMS